MIDEHGKDFGPSSTVSQDEAHEVPDEKGSAEDMSDPDIADEDDEDTRSFRTNAWEEDDTFIPSINRPQSESRIEEVSRHTQSLSMY